jgi:hypothetical protein
MRQVSRSSSVDRRPMLVLKLGGYVEYKHGECAPDDDGDPVGPSPTPRRPTEELYRTEIVGAAGLMSGIGQPILTRLEAAGWVESCWEEVDPQIAGRPARRYYRLTMARTRRVGLGVGLPSPTGPTGTPSRTGLP